MSRSHQDDLLPVCNWCMTTNPLLRSNLDSCINCGPGQPNSEGRENRWLAVRLFAWCGITYVIGISWLYYNYIFRFLHKCTFMIMYVYVDSRLSLQSHLWVLMYMCALKWGWFWSFCIILGTLMVRPSVWMGWPFNKEFRPWYMNFFTLSNMRLPHPSLSFFHQFWRHRGSTFYENWGHSKDRIGEVVKLSHSKKIFGGNLETFRKVSFPCLTPPGFVQWRYDCVSIPWKWFPFGKFPHQVFQTFLFFSRPFFLRGLGIPTNGGGFSKGKYTLKCQKTQI